MKRIVVILAFLAPGPLAACSICILAIVDGASPPGYLWLFLPPCLFVTNALASRATGIPLPFQPGPGTSLGIALAAVVLGGMFLGPFATVPLVIPPLLAVVPLMRPSTAWRSARGRNIILAASVLAVGSVAASLVYGQVLGRERTDVEFICTWSGTGPARGKLKAIIAKGSGGADELRYVVAACPSSFLTVEAAEALALSGDYRGDRAIFEAALRRFSGDTWATEQIRRALERLRQRHVAGA